MRWRCWSLGSDSVVFDKKSRLGGDGEPTTACGGRDCCYWAATDTGRVASSNSTASTSPLRVARQATSTP